MITKRTKKNKGFVILFAVTLSSIILAIALGVAEIALKEVKFSTSDKDTSNAFFATDTGVECALFNDKGAASVFPAGGPATPITCATNTITPVFTPNSNGGIYNFVVTGLGSNGLSCANVSVLKDSVTNSPSTITTITSKGYNIGDATCSSSNPDRIEREIKVSY